MNTNRDFSIVDENAGIEVFVFTEFHKQSKKWIPVYSHAADIKTGMPVYVDDRGKYTEMVLARIEELNATDKRVK